MSELQDRMSSQEARIDSHGRTLAEHGIRLDMHRDDIGRLWKVKVSLERYVWVERIVMAGCGAVLFWALQGVLAK